MTTPADTHRAGPFAPNFEQPDRPTLSISDYDALADLFLGDSDDQSTTADAAEDRIDIATSEHASSPMTPSAPNADEPSSETTVEAVIVGHLPVRANLWVMQYARHTAEQLGKAVAVLRTIGDEVAIDLLSPSTMKRSFNTVDARSLDEALATAASVAPHWIVTTDELAENELLSDERFNRVSLLTSAARTSTAAAYGTLKRAITRTQLPTDQVFRFVFLGSDFEDAARASIQLRTAVQASLGFDVEVATGPRRIDATRAVPLYRGRLTDSSGSIIDLVEQARRLAEEPPVPEHSVQDPREHEQAEPEAKTAPSAVELRLCTMLEGLTDLPLTCPIESRVQIALDEQDRIHLLATGDGPDPVRSLTQAGAWAALNRELILAAAQRTNAESGDPVLHLLVEDAPTNRRLLDAPIRVHLLRSISVQDAEPVWFAAPLN